MPKAGGKKKSPAFFTDQHSLDAFGVAAKGALVRTFLGMTPSVVGVKRSAGDEGEGTLWVDYRCGYRSPLEKDKFEPCSKAVNVWKDVDAFNNMVEADAMMRDKIHELNERYKIGLMEKQKKNKKK